MATRTCPTATARPPAFPLEAERPPRSTEAEGRRRRETRNGASTPRSGQFDPRFPASPPARSLSLSCLNIWARNDTKWDD